MEGTEVAIRTLIFALVVTLTGAGFAEGQAVVINVSNTEKLYQAVNNPANSGAVVVVVPGIYTLTPKDPNGQSRPNGGRLVLQTGMALVGQNEYVDFDGDAVWDPRDDNSDNVPDTDPVRGLIFAAPATETIIDAVGMVSGGQGAIRVGLDNRVEKLTVRNTRGVGAAIDVNVLPPIGGMRSEIHDCLLEDGQRGIRMQHSQLNGIDSVAMLERNIFRRHTGVLFAFAAQIQNGNSTNSSWDVVVRNNLFYSNRFGLFVTGNSSTIVQSRVLSIQNVYRQNQTGVNLFAGLDSSNVEGKGNSIHFTSVEDGIFDNLETDNLGGLGAGVVAVAGIRQLANATESSNDELFLQFLGTRWRGNFQGANRRDLLVYGAVALAGSPGMNDTARVLVRNGTSDGAAGAFLFIDSQPIDVTNSDHVTVLGSNVAFVHANVGIDPLPEWHFAPED
jgi:hypothetical protein